MGYKKNMKIKRSFDLSAAQFRWLTEEAKKLGLSISEFLRRIIDKARGA